jgi:polyisoprenoid-binding protein YceI
MFKKQLLSTVAGFLILAPVASADSGDAWNVDPMHSNAHFSVRHMMISNVEGDLGHISGSVNYDGKALSKATVEATIDTSTINTREPNRDEHLKSAEFFDTAKYPTISFKSKSIDPSDNDKFKLTGELTIHGVTKQVVLDAEKTSTIKDMHGNTRMGASAKTTLNRKDFGLSWNKQLDNGGAVVGDDVYVVLNLELVKAKTASTADSTKTNQ